jgi:O-antigen/teichoic acid export membrane protein
MLINVGLNALMIPAYGMTGAAVATAISSLFWSFSALIFVVRVMKLNPTMLPSSWLGLKPE